jgi:nucleoid DNA-binding protein
LNTNELVKQLAERLDKPQTQVRDVLVGTTEICRQVLGMGNSFSFPRFGTFNVSHRKEREAQNPRTGQRLMLPPKDVVSFQSSNVLKENIKDIKVS